MDFKNRHLSITFPLIKTSSDRDARRRKDQPWRALYSTPQWRALRTAQLRQQSLCERCLSRNVIKPATVVHHRTAHKGDRALFFDSTNLASLCKPCHDVDEQRAERGFKTKPYVGVDGWAKVSDQDFEEQRRPTSLKPSAIPLTIVCGPPGSGKSTYIRQHAGPNDVVIDLDQIMSQLSGLPEHQTHGTSYLDQAIKVRNAKLAALATDTTHDRAWFIVAAEHQRDRQAWASMLGAKLVTLTTPLEDCIRRIQADPYRLPQDHHRMIQAATKWWLLNRNSGAHYTVA